MTVSPWIIRKHAGKKNNFVFFEAEIKKLSTEEEGMQAFQSRQKTICQGSFRSCVVFSAGDQTPGLGQLLKFSPDLCFREHEL